MRTSDSTLQGGSLLGGFWSMYKLSLVGGMITLIFEWLKVSHLVQANRSGSLTWCCHLS